MSSQPNIVLFMVDQLSARWLEAAVSGVSKVPNFTALMEAGTYFRQTITANPVCCPTRATLATGLTTRGHGVLENGYQLDPALPTFMRALQSGNGADPSWRTGAFGKVHLLPHFAGLYPDYRPYGFDTTHITEDARGGEWLDWVEANHPDHYDSVLSEIWATGIAEWERYGPDGKNLKARIESLRESADWATQDWPQNTFFAHPLPFPDEVSQTSWITARAVEFIKSTDANRPLFAHISYVQPHSPFTPPEAFMGSVDVDALPTPVGAEWQSDPCAPRYFRDKKPADVEWRHARHCYFADLAHLDAQLGTVMQALEETGRSDNTFVIFLSDHGELLGDHGFYSKEERHYDACIRVPLIVSGPAVVKGQTRDEIVQLEDICPTILEIAGLSLEPMPKMGPYLKTNADDIPIMAGRSLLPLCAGARPSDWRDAAYSESYNNIGSASPGNWARTIRTAEYRYTFYAMNGGEQLFDLQNDPEEQRNVVAEADYASVRQDLRDRLMELIVMQDYPKTRRELFALGVH